MDNNKNDYEQFPEPDEFEFTSVKYEVDNNRILNLRMNLNIFLNGNNLKAYSKSNVQ